MNKRPQQTHPYEPQGTDDGENTEEIEISFRRNVHVEERSEQRRDNSGGKMSGKKQKHLRGIRYSEPRQQEALRCRTAEYAQEKP